MPMPTEPPSSHPANVTVAHKSISTTPIGIFGIRFPIATSSPSFGPQPHSADIYTYIPRAINRNPNNMKTIGVVEMLLWTVVTLIGWLLGGSVGIGTVISTFGAGAVMHLFFDVIGFEPRKLEHKSLTESLAQLFKKV